MAHNGNKQTVVLLGPELKAVSGVSTHLRCLIESRLGLAFDLRHFPVGSEARDENTSQKLMRYLFSPFGLARLILSHKAAVVHINTSLVQRSFWRDLCFLFIGKMLGRRIVYQVHGGSLPQEFFQGGALTAFVRWVLQLPDAIVVLAQAELEAYRAFVPGQSIAMIPNAIDVSPFAGRARARAGEGSVLKLAYLGRLIKDKGLYELLEGFRLARAQGIDARLVIAGNGPEEASLRRHVAAAGLAEHVTLPGPVFGERKVAMLAETDIFVLPTYHVEGLPYALLEAMAAGAAVITTRVGAIPDVVTEAVHGLFVPPRDPQAITRAIARLASDRHQLARMSAACRRRIADGYSAERLSTEFRGLYSEMCAAKRVKTCAE